MTEQENLLLHFDLNNYKHFDPKVLGGYSLEELSPMSIAWPRAVAAVGFLSGFEGSQKGSVLDFPFDNVGVSWVQKYLDTMVIPHVIELNESGYGVKACSPSGVEAADPEKGLVILHGDQAAHYLDLRFMAAGTVLGLCIAHGAGMTFAPEKGAPIHPELHEGGSTINPWPKPWKYCRNGKEDSLLPLYQMAKDLPRLRQAVRARQ